MDIYKPTLTVYIIKAIIRVRNILFSPITLRDSTKDRSGEAGVPGLPKLIDQWETGWGTSKA